MRYTRTAIGLLSAQYRSILKKCLMINLGLFALCAVATPAKATDYTTDRRLLPVHRRVLAMTALPWIQELPTAVLSTMPAL